jgi:hypothetical protein
MAASKNVKLFSKDGVEMMDVKAIDLDRDVLVIKGKMMGAMATTIHVKPEDIWRAFRMFPWRVKCRLPLLLWKGWRQQRTSR